MQTEKKHFQLIMFMANSWFFGKLHLFGKLSTFVKFVISLKLINIFKFGFDLLKSPEIYYKKQLSFEKLGIFLTPNFASQKGQHEWNTL